MSLRDAGWCWEGQAVRVHVPPSIFGAGEGCRFFGLGKATFLFHETTEMALQKMSELEEVVCDISKWRQEYTSDGGWKTAFRGGPEVALAEARKLNGLARKFPNITGAYLDDFMGNAPKDRFEPEHLAEVSAALKEGRPNLKLWTVVYSHELEPEQWQPYIPHFDVVSLWVWHNYRDLRNLDEYVVRARDIFPDKSINLGVYMRDYPIETPMPIELLEFQFERILRYLDEGAIDGYSIIAGCLIDLHPEQAHWIRDFISAH